MDISQLLKDWFASDKTEVEPSLLAYVLLCKIKIGSHKIAQTHTLLST